MWTVVNLVRKFVDIPTVQRAFQQAQPRATQTTIK